MPFLNIFKYCDIELFIMHKTTVSERRKALKRKALELAKRCKGSDEGGKELARSQQESPRATERG
jgi:hypothetical protein